jgi:5-(carboxyamino)imidazole ribonucleotide synthase
MLFAKLKLNPYLNIQILGSDLVPTSDYQDYDYIIMTPILILGHGQLGLMLAAEAAKFGIEVDRLDLSSAERLVGTSCRRDKFDEQLIFSHYGKITAELEHLPDTDLIHRIKQSPNWINAQAFTQLIDRSDQKTLLDKLTLPTAPWCSVDTVATLESFNANHPELVVKTTRGGYDGRGQWRVNKNILETIPADQFGKLIAESKINFIRELSIVGARNEQGQCSFHPLAENTHKDGILRYSAVREDIDPELQIEGETLLSSLMTHLNYTGVMAVECFQTDDGLMINEVAPRVHNSGHWSQLGTVHNQFALHMRALLNLPLPKSIEFRPTLMLNLIGCDFNPDWLSVNHVQIHWYGKSLRDGRKMGHINIDAGSERALHDVKKQLAPLLDTEHKQLLKDAVENFQPCT